MMRWIVWSSLRFRLLVVAVAAVTMFVGIAKLRHMPLDLFPEFSPPYVEIQTEALGLSAAEVEAMITVPLEADLLNGVAWLKTIRSESLPGLSSIVLIFESGTDIMRARQMVQERLTQSYALPGVSKPPVMLQPLSSTSRVMNVSLESNDLSLIQMSVLARWTIKPRLMGVPGVANVSIWGQRKRQLQVLVDPERLRENNVTLRQIIKTTGDALWWSPLSFLNASTPGTGGFIDTPNQRLGIRHELPISTAEDLAQVTVDGTEFRLADVAAVVEDHQPLIGDAMVDDEPGLILVIEKFPWANTLEVTRGVEAALDALRPGLSGLEMDSTVFRPATYLEMAIENLEMAILVAFGLIIIALGALFHNWRTALICLVAIPLSLLAALLVFWLRGVAINTMLLAGLVIAIGVVVDDAIIDVENIVRRLRMHRAQFRIRSAARAILEASVEMRSAIVYATLIVVLAVVPVFFMPGLAGAFFKPLALAFVLAVLASMLVALTVTPALGLLLLPKSPLARSESGLVRSLQSGYKAVLARTAAKPALGFLFIAVLVIAAIAVLPRMGQSLFPSLKETDVLIDWQGPAGTSRPAMNRIMAQASSELESLQGVRSVGGHVGRAITGDQVVGVNSGEIWVGIDPGADYDATIASIQEVVDGYPGLRRDVLTYSQERIRKALTGAGEAIVVRLYGWELDVLRDKAEEVKQALSNVEGLSDLRVEMQSQEPVIEIEVDFDRAKPYGLKPGDVRRAAAALLSGIEVGYLFEEQKVFDVVVWGTPETRHSLTSVKELLIETPTGDDVRLGDVADVRIVPSPNGIKREGVSRCIDITGNLIGRDLGSVARDVESALSGVDFPLEYHAELLGEYAERQAAERRTLGFAIAAVIGIFLLLQASFGSWRLASLAFLTLPAALVGGVLAAFVFDNMISISSIVGFLAVLGIAARNGIMMINRFQHLEHQEGVPFGTDLVLRGALERLSPILMTATTTGLAVLPFAILGNVAGYELIHPLAVVLLGGIVTSTALNLFVLPALYLRFGAGVKPESAVLGLDPGELEPTHTMYEQDAG